MTPPADVVQLLHGASSSFTTLAAAVRTWEHPARFQQACHQAGVFGTSAATSCLPGADPDEIEWTGRVWLGGPDRFRVEERDRQGGQRIVAVDRDRWFMQTSRGQLVADDGLPPAGAYGFADVLEAALYPRWPEYQPIGRALHSGRECLRVLARGCDIPDWRIRPAELVGDERELLIDAERGVVLRVESRTAGQPFYVADLCDVVFDEPMADSLFSLQAKPGSPVLSYAEYEAYPWPCLADAVQRASFTVLVPSARRRRIGGVLVRSARRAGGSAAQLPARIRAPSAAA